ncbi:MAG: amidohydrolase family protein [Ardenticatenia bacterium]|nr:amidohydrolase family protein [Ardenticatenia bacterium]
MAPVLTNAHTHLELTGLAHLCPTKPMEFTRWIQALIREQALRTPADVRRSVERGIEELLAAGTTHVGDITATWLSVEPLLASGLRGIVWLEVLGLKRHEALERLEQAKAAIEQARRRPGSDTMRVGLTIHAPYSCHPDLFREGTTWCREADVPLCIHLAESPDEVTWLTRRAGPFGRLLRRLGLPVPPAPGLRPVLYLHRLGVLAARPLLVHMVQVTAEEVRLVAEAGCAVVHCPRSNFLLNCGRMPLEMYVAAGVPVYVGTDSRASSPSLDVREEVAFARPWHGDRVPAKVWDTMLSRPL